MLERLVWIFGGAWLLGVSGVFVSRALFGTPLDSTPALLSASFWLVGGVGFLLLGGSALLLESRARASERIRASDRG